VTCTVVLSPSGRTTVSFTDCPGRSSASAPVKASASGVAVPLSAVITSPALIPALAAGSPLVTDTTPAPAGEPLALVTVLTATPSAARPEFVTRPLFASWRAMSLAVLDKIANPMPGAAPPPSC
jgi:hypothetical protein